MIKIAKTEYLHGSMEPYTKAIHTMPGGLGIASHALDHSATVDSLEMKSTFQFLLL